MKKIISVTRKCMLGLSLTLTCGAFAQTSTSWVKRIGGVGTDDVAINGLAKDAAGNVYSVGVYSTGNTFLGGPDTLPVNNTGSYDVFVLKSNASGSVVWLKQIATTTFVAGSAPVYPYALDADAAGNVYVTGTYSRGTVDFDPGTGVVNPGLGNNGGQNMFILKLNTSGEYQWHKEIRDTAASATATCASRAIKVDASGNIHTLCTFKGRVFFGLPATASGMLQSTGTANNTAVMKLNAAGALQWVKQFSTTGSNTCNPFDLDVDHLGNVYAVGDFTGLATDLIDFDPAHSTPSGTSSYTSAGSNDIFMAKLDASGNYVWSKKIGTSNADYCYGIAVNSTSVQITGNFAGANNLNFDPGGTAAPLLNSGGSTDIYVARYNLSGAFQWVKRFGGPGSDAGRNIALADNGDIYVTGDFAGSTDFDPLTTGTQAIASYGSSDAYILKLNSAGDFGYVVGMGTAGTSSAGDRATAVAVHTSGGNRSIYTIGFFGAASMTVPAVFPINFNGTTTPSATLSSAGGQDVFLHKTQEIICTPTTSSLTLTTCDSFTIAGNTYTSSGTYSPVLINATGCDSVITLNLTVSHSYAGNFMQVACDSFVFDNQTYLQGGNYTHTFTGAAGCDSVVTLFLAITNSSAATVTESFCDTFTYDGIAYTQAGTYIHTFANATGCDSVVTLVLNQTPVDTSVTQENITLTAQAAGAVYQWLNCSNGNAVIPGATSQRYTPVQDGSYSVIITKNGCSDTSSCHPVSGTVGIGELQSKHNVTAVYPNPVADIMYIESPGSASAEIYSIEGKLLQIATLSVPVKGINVARLADGIYFIKILDGKHRVVSIAKWIKQTR